MPIESLSALTLATHDMPRAVAFYETLGFTATGGDGAGYLIMANGTTIIGLFHGMFDGNILTFNPGLSQTKEQLQSFQDVRDIRDRLVEEGVELTSDTYPEGTGPAHITLVDPDGNAILIDQFFPRPGPGGD